MARKRIREQSFEEARAEAQRLRERREDADRQDAARAPEEIRRHFADHAALVNETDEECLPAQYEAMRLWDAEDELGVGDYPDKE